MNKRTAYTYVVAVGSLFCVLLMPGCRDETVRTPAEQMEAAGEQAMRYFGNVRQAMRDGRYDEALAWVDSVLVVAPELPVAHYQRGQILLELYQLQEADDAFQRTMELDPNHWGGWYKRGHVAFEQGNYREALRRYQRQRDVILTSPEKLYAYYRQMGEAALPQTWLQIGRAYDLLQRPDSARWAYEEVLALDSTYAQAHAWLAGLHDDEGRTQEALAHARRAWRHERNNPAFTYQLGKLLLEGGHPSEALPLLEYAADVQPWNPGVHYNLGRTLVALGRTVEGQEHLGVTDQLQALNQQIDQARAAAAQYPNEPARWLTLADLLGRAGRQEEQHNVLSVARSVAKNAGDETRSDAH